MRSIGVYTFPIVHSVANTKPQSVIFSLVILTGLIACAVSAQESTERDSPEINWGDMGTAQLRYGSTYRSGSQQDTGPSLSYKGITLNDPNAEVRFYGRSFFGFEVYGERESFTLTQGTSKVGGAAVWRAEAGPVVRILSGRLRFEVGVDYGFDKLLTFGSTINPYVNLVQRHSVIGKLRVLLYLPRGFAASVEGAYPYTVALRKSNPSDLKASGWRAGASLTWSFARSPYWQYGINLKYEYENDLLRDADVRSPQTLSRFGLGLQVDWLNGQSGPSLPAQGSLKSRLRVSVKDDSGEQLTAPLEVSWMSTSDSQVVILHKDPKTQDWFSSEVPVGEGKVRATAAGYVPAEAPFTATAEAEGTYALALQRVPPPLGSVKITLSDKETGAPIQGATVRLNDQQFKSDPSGQVLIEALKAGPISIAVKARGYLAVEEAVSVLAGQSSEAVLALVKTENKLPATVIGTVRNARGGDPIVASLFIPELKLKIRADAQGRFTFQVKGGIYKVIISAPGFYKQTKSVDVKEGDEAIFNVDLHPLR